MKYPIPDLSFRREMIYETPIEGEVVAYQTDTCVGLMLLERPSWFLRATHFDSDPDYVWSEDEVPTKTKFFYPTEEECIWGYDEFIKHLLTDFETGNGNDPILAYLDRNLANIFENHSGKIICNIIERLPYHIKDIKQYEAKIWNNGLKEIGVDFNRKKAEIYCYFLSVVRIWEYTKGHEQNYRWWVYQLYENWKHFSWMYGMVLGRIVGSADKNFTALVNHLDCKNRCPYIHLYVPLIEQNIEKYPEYNNVEKKKKLLDAIAKIKLTGEREQQDSNLDELFSVLFPQQFLRLAHDNHPVASVAELKDECEKLKLDLDIAKKNTTIININAGATYNDIHDNINPTIH